MIARLGNAISESFIFLGLFVVTLIGVFGFILMLGLELIFGRSNPSTPKDPEHERITRCCNHDHRLN